MIKPARQPSGLIEGKIEANGHHAFNQTQQLQPIMITIMFIPMLAAAGYSILYLLFGGGLFGAVVIFFIAKMLGK
ncbi:MAG: hypothetical protein JWR19_1321 [Pedosphaera sp.]|nr:hypothetical protein [Pedosphaera sp.]